MANFHTTALCSPTRSSLLNGRNATSNNMACITEGADVTLRSRRGEARMRAHLSPDVRRDTVFAPFHWANEATINDLTHPALDPASRMPEFKTCAVALRPSDA